MNKNFLPIFEKLKKEIIELHYRWSIFRSVYASGAENIALLNRHGPNFFHYVQHLMLDHFSLSFSKLTDPNKLGKFENLSLKQIHVYASEHNETDFVRELKEKFELLANACTKFRDLRNKRIAHADLNHAIGEDELPGISRQYIEDALKLLREYINTVELHYNDSQTLYTGLICTPNTGGDALINALQLAEKNV